MSAVEGVDYSWGRPGGAALRAAGKSFAARYLWPGGPGGKGLDAAEARDLADNGIALVLCFEGFADGWRGGRAAGLRDGAAAAAELRALRLEPAPVHFAVDRDTTAADWPVVDAYLAGAGEGLGDPSLVGVYGEADLIDHCAAAGIRWLWQTYAWSRGRVSARATLLQYRNGASLGGAAVDLDRALAADYGQVPRPRGDAMLAALPDAPGTPWDQLLDLAPDAIITAVDGRQIPLRSGGQGVWSPFAVSASLRAVRFSTGGVAQIGTVPLASCRNLRPRAAPPSAAAAPGAPAPERAPGIGAWGAPVDLSSPSSDAYRNAQQWYYALLHPDAARAAGASPVFGQVLDPSPVDSSGASAASFGAWQLGQLLGGIIGSGEAVWGSSIYPEIPPEALAAGGEVLPVAEERARADAVARGRYIPRPEAGRAAQDAAVARALLIRDSEG